VKLPAPCDKIDSLSCCSQGPAQNGGGPLVFDDGHHKFALGWHFMGQAEEVHAWIGATEVAPGAILDSPSIVSWKFANGRVGALEVVYSPELVLDTQHYAQDDRVELTGTKGVIWITRGHGKMMDVPPIDAFFAGESPSLTGEQGRAILAFTLAAQESTRLGQPLK
jgi:predicted dehydrogenase